MKAEKICKYCKYWDIESKFKYGMGESGTVHCHFNGNYKPYESCSKWEFASDRTEEELDELKKRYGIY